MFISVSMYTYVPDERVDRIQSGYEEERRKMLADWRHEVEQISSQLENECNVITSLMSHHHHRSSFGVDVGVVYVE
jgi:hypothetical protein